MWKRVVLLVGAGTIAALMITGCSSDDSTAGHSAGHESSAATSATAGPNAQDHNDADVTFAAQMIPHHQQAIEMSDVMLARRDVDPRIIELATAIKAAQGPEIKQMQGWLGQWGNPPMPPMEAGEGHDGHDIPGMSGDGMGMMSDEQMTALKNADGAGASKLFLTGMIGHHEGAIDMAQNEIKDGKFAPAVDMARTIVKTQQEEIDTMKGLLATL
jgi:uncharacterized protein (DUF305 family)